MVISKKTQQKIVSRLVLLAIIVIGLLSACGTADMDVTVYSGDRFDLKLNVLIPSDTFQMMGGAQEIEAELNEIVNSAKEEGFDLRWRSVNTRDDSTYGYEFTIPKTKITEETNDLFTWREVYYNNRDAYRIEFTDIADISYMFMSFTLNLHVGRILDTNGDQIDSRTVTWVNPTQTPYAIVTPKSSVGWIPLALAIFMVLMLGLAVVVLIITGKFSEWSSAGINAGKWKIQETKLKGQKKKITQEKDELISELGKKAWEAKVLHPSYTEPYFELESLDEQKNAHQDQVDTLSKELNQTRESRAKLASDYSNQISELQSRQKEVGKKLNQAKSEQSALQQELSKVQKDREKAHSEIKAYQDKLIEVQASDSPEKESQTASLSNAINSLEGAVQKMGNRVPEIEARLSSLKIEQQPLEDQINRFTEQIAVVQKDLKEALTPLDQRIVELEGEVKSKKLEIDDIKQKMAPIIDSLGPLVNSARPESENLSAVYEQIDSVNSNLVSVSQEHGLVKTRLDTSDKDAVRNFYIMVAGFLVLVVLAVVFFGLAFM
jgi:chromosome segregation ATPase